MRTYSAHSIDQLEDLVEQNINDSSVLQAVKDELGNRKGSPRQRKLLDKINRLVTAKAIRIDLPAYWTDHITLEKVFSSTVRKPIQSGSAVHIFVPNGCNIMVSAAVQILSLVNQLLEADCAVTIEFDAGWSGTMNYLKRINFFKQLDKSVNVIPSLCGENHQTRHQGNNLAVVEIERINLQKEDKLLPKKLTSSVLDRVGLKGKKLMQLETAILTLFAELTSNVYQHSHTILPAYAVCQRYAPDGESVVHVTVCDSGNGILDTIRHALPIHYSHHPEYQKLSDEDLILKMFLDGLSSKGDNDGGSGLVSCAIQAMKFKSTISIRTNDTLTLLTPYRDYYEIDTQPLPDHLVHIKGTYITFKIPLYGLT